jgi:hypothetical protein
VFFVARQPLAARRLPLGIGLLICGSGQQGLRGSGGAAAATAALRAERTACDRGSSICRPACARPTGKKVPHRLSKQARRLGKTGRVMGLGVRIRGPNAP